MIGFGLQLADLIESVFGLFFCNIIADVVFFDRIVDVVDPGHERFNDVLCFGKHVVLIAPVRFHVYFCKFVLLCFQEYLVCHLFWLRGR